jgi:ferredoxin--NADP+ reductase
MMTGHSPNPSPKVRIAGRRELLPGRLFELSISAPRVAAAASAGHFVIIQATPTSRRVSLPIAGLDGREAGNLDIVFDSQTTGASGLAALKPGIEPAAVLGPIGKPSGVHEGTVLLVGQGAPAFGLAPIAKDILTHGGRVGCLLIGEPDYTAIMGRLLACEAVQTTEDIGAVNRLLAERVEALRPSLILAAGGLSLLRAVQSGSAEFGVPARLRVAPKMLDGAGMCGGCRVKVEGRLLFCCREGTEFDASGMDLDYLEGRERACRASAGDDRA